MECCQQLDSNQVLDYLGWTDSPGRDVCGRMDSTRLDNVRPPMTGTPRFQQKLDNFGMESRVDNIHLFRTSSAEPEEETPLSSESALSNFGV